MSEQTNTGTPEPEPATPSNPEADTPPEADQSAALSELQSAHDALETERDQLTARVAELESAGAEAETAASDKDARLAKLEFLLGEYADIDIDEELAFVLPGANEGEFRYRRAAAVAEAESGAAPAAKPAPRTRKPAQERRTQKPPPIDWNKENDNLRRQNAGLPPL